MPRLVDHDERRREFALAVWGIVAERGIEGVTLREVARAANVSVGRVQHYYATREELVRDSCRVMLEIAEEQLEGGVTGLGPGARLRALVLHAVPATTGLVRGTAVWTAYLAKSVDDPGIADLVRESHRGAVDLAADSIQEARAQGAMREADAARDLALELLALSEGYAARVLTGSLTAEEAVAALERRLAIESP